MKDIDKITGLFDLMGVEYTKTTKFVSTEHAIFNYNRGTGEIESVESKKPDWAK